MVQMNKNIATKSAVIESDKKLLSQIGIHIDKLRSATRQKRTFYRNIVQCLRKCEIMSNQDLMDNYLESIMYLCRVRDFAPIQKILNTAILLNQDFPKIVVPLSEYLLIKGLYRKLVAVCENILDSFDNENIDLLEIEFLLAKGKSGIVDRVTSCQLFQEFQAKTQANSLLYLQSLVCLAHGQLNIGNYKDSLSNFKKVLIVIQENQFFSTDLYRIHEVKANIFEGMARLAMIDNNWKKSLLFYKRLEDICKTQNFMPKLVNCLGHQGVINRKVNNYDVALEYLQESKKVAIKINSPRAIEWVNHHTAYVFLNKGQYDLAEELAEECLVKAILEKRDNEVGDFYEQVGLIKLGKNNINKAIENLELSLFFRQKVGNHHGTASSYKHLFLAYFIKKQYIKSYIAIKKCLVIFYKLKILGFARTYRIVHLFLEWTIGNKSWTS
ncbi:MAG: tetratricopeptide repeat protein [Limnothrix sp. RL_2_0]|nr:tetratricopeptide repeat protein [Limnothrix sp. RL_2_0]